MIASRSVLIQTTPGYLRALATRNRLHIEGNRPTYASMTLEKLYELRSTAQSIIPQYTKDSPSLPKAQERLACIEREIVIKETDALHCAVVDELF